MADSEVIVIGGGIAGVSAAYHLAGLGRSVLLLERGDIASEASGVNAGGIGALGWETSPDLESYLTMGSLRIFEQLQFEHGYDIEFRASGALQAVQPGEQHEYATSLALSLQSRGYVAEFLPVWEARRIEPELSPELAGALHLPLRAQADPQKATRSITDAAAQLGAEIITGREVTGIDRQPGGPFRVTSGGDVYRAKSLVLAAGAWCGPLGEMLGLRIPIFPVRGQMWAAGPLPPTVFHSISAAESPLHWKNHPGAGGNTPPELTHVAGRRVTRHLYGRQSRNGELVFGGDRQLCGYDKTVDLSGIQVNFAHAAEVLPMLHQQSISRTWAGLMPFSLDGKPVIGKIPHVDDLYIVTGLASSGFGRGPMAGKLIADCVHTGRPSPLLSQADPARCITALA